jgi:glycosyltransferase involved in cell wall biosynthesis
VVSTSVGLVPDAVADGVTGSVVPVGRPDELATAIVDLALDDERRRAMGDAGRRRVLDFDVVRSLRALEARYLEIAGPGAPDGRRPAGIEAV